jgi:hypothetical protein
MSVQIELKDGVVDMTNLIIKKRITLPFTCLDKKELAEYKDDVCKFLTAIRIEANLCDDDVYSNGYSAKEFRKIFYTMLKWVSEYQLLAVKDCNKGLNDDDKFRESEIEKWLTERGAYLGVVFTFEGDPRGFTIKMKTPRSGKYNTWGGADVGYGVPCSEMIKYRSFEVFEKWILSLKR